uniref:Uncharacterized protein n=1 Tax=Trypanosoma vivax (strain Y486) TaxID=1055687 RepID=G0U558_TRYVY|nr:hypothetical protein TVY486_1000600 [Trypanosoma vivax Y486]
MLTVPTSLTCTTSRGPLPGVPRCGLHVAAGNLHTCTCEGAFGIPTSPSPPPLTLFTLGPVEVNFRHSGHLSHSPITCPRSVIISLTFLLLTHTRALVHVCTHGISSHFLFCFCHDFPNPSQVASLCQRLYVLKLYFICPCDLFSSHFFFFFEKIYKKTNCRSLSTSRRCVNWRCSTGRQTTWCRFNNFSVFLFGVEVLWNY